MKSDIELLELAAKAAGMSGPVGEMLGGGFYIADAKAQLGMWAPLTDDGDALRLAVKLGMFGTLEGFKVFQSFYSDEISKDNRPTEATRRAIVCIAAATVEGNQMAPAHQEAT